MIVTDNVRFGRREFKRTYSDEDYLIRKIGTDEIYSEAVDVLDSSYEYEETEEKIPSEV